MNRIEQIENYVKPLMVGEIAHDFKHLDRVRQWALQIAQQEGYEDLDIVEATALLHDIGLSAAEREQHAQKGAELAAAFLSEKQLFSPAEIGEITYAIRLHSSLDGDGKLLEILRDADILDLLGAVGLMRAFTSKYSNPEYDPANVKGSTWEMAGVDVTQRFRQGVGIGNFIVDQVNFQISCYDNLRTETARRLAKTLVQFMKAYLIQLEAEINQSP